MTAQADTKLLERFADWMLANSTHTHSAMGLKKAVATRSPVIGARIKNAMENAGSTSGGMQDLNAAMREGFSNEQIAEVLGLMYEPQVIWSTGAAARQRRRLETLDKIAAEEGHESWRAFETARIRRYRDEHSDDAE